MCCTIILIILAFLIPPVPVIYLQGLYSKDFLLNVLLLMLGYVPAVIHAIYLIFHNDKGARHGYSDLEAHGCHDDDSHESHDGIYQQGWNDRGRIETDLRNNSSNIVPSSNDPKQVPPPPYSMQ
ncbi:hypothetical protein ACO0SA_003182 [Hanseniaspora valbyensis]